MIEPARTVLRERSERATVCYGTPLRASCARLPDLPRASEIRREIKRETSAGAQPHPGPFSCTSRSHTCTHPSSTTSRTSRTAPPRRAATTVTRCASSTRRWAGSSACSSGCTSNKRRCSSSPETTGVATRSASSEAATRPSNHHPDPNLTPTLTQTLTLTLALTRQQRAVCGRVAARARRRRIDRQDEHVGGRPS